jgi:hypothetical protein
MKFLKLIASAVCMAAPVLAQTPEAQPAPLLHASTSFDLVVHLPYARATALFGPEGERAWAGKHWDPQFIHPQPAADIEGAVFTISHGPMKAVWVNTLFDKDAHHFQYVYFLPDLLVTVIDVRFTQASANVTGVHITYTRTAITPEGNEHVASMSEGDKLAGNDWQQAIDAYLAKSKSATTLEQRRTQSHPIEIGHWQATPLLECAR